MILDDLSKAQGRANTIQLISSIQTILTIP